MVSDERHDCHEKRIFFAGKTLQKVHEKSLNFTLFPEWTAGSQFTFLCIRSLDIPPVQGEKQGFYWGRGADLIVNSEFGLEGEFRVHFFDQPQNLQKNSDFVNITDFQGIRTRTTFWSKYDKNTVPVLKITKMTK